MSDKLSSYYDSSYWNSFRGDFNIDIKRKVVFLMSIWLFRAGRNGEYESKFLEDKRIYLTWDGLNVDLSKYEDRDKLLQKLTEMYNGEKPNTIRNWAS